MCCVINCERPPKVFYLLNKFRFGYCLRCEIIPIKILTKKERWV